MPRPHRRPDRAQPRVPGSSCLSTSLLRLSTSLTSLQPSSATASTSLAMGNAATARDRDHDNDSSDDDADRPQDRDISVHVHIARRPAPPPPALTLRFPGSLPMSWVASECLRRFPEAADVAGLRLLYGRQPIDLALDAHEALCDGATVECGTSPPLCRVRPVPLSPPLPPPKCTRAACRRRARQRCRRSPPSNRRKPHRHERLPLEPHPSSRRAGGGPCRATSPRTAP